MSEINVAYYKLVQICGEQHVLHYSEEISDYGKDQTMGLFFAFDLLVRPGSAEEVSEILRVCNEYRIVVTPRGGGSGVSGGALPLKRGVVLSLERLNKIIFINELDRYVVAEAGVIAQDLCNAVEARGYYYPAAPSSKGFSFLGGNVATDAGSIHSCQFGKTGNYVLNLEIVLPGGDIIWTGANVSKSSSGFNLTQLFVGSEGLLGIITKVVYRLLPEPGNETMILCGFSSLWNAIEALCAVKRSGFPLSIGEFFCPGTIKLVSEYLGEQLPLVRDGICYHLLLGFRSNERAREFHLIAIVDIVEKFTDIEMLVGQTGAEKELLIKLRNNIGKALISNGRTYRDIDAAVPVSSLYSYILKAESIAVAYNIRFIYFGHALDGNLHIMLLQENGGREGVGEIERNALNEIYEFVTDCEGVISGEHGIGVLQKDFLKLQYSPKNIEVMKQIKHLFDPNGILNPGKVL